MRTLASIQGRNFAWNLRGLLGSSPAGTRWARAASKWGSACTKQACATVSRCEETWCQETGANAQLPLALDGGKGRQHGLKSG